MPALLSRFSLLFINYISRNLNYTKILLCKLFVRYLVVKPACVNAASYLNKIMVKYYIYVQRRTIMNNFEGF